MKCVRASYLILNFNVSCESVSPQPFDVSPLYRLIAMHSSDKIHESSYPS